MTRRREIHIRDGDFEASYTVDLPDGDEMQDLARRAYRVDAMPPEQRAALRLWLKGAVAKEAREVSDLSASPGTLLIAALDALDLGTTYPMLRPQRTGAPGHPPNGPTARAKAHVVAAVDLLARFPDIGGIAAAIRMVADASGLTPVAVRSLRDQVHAGSAYAEVREQLDAESELIDRALAMPGGRLLAFANVLLRLHHDRRILALQKL